MDRATKAIGMLQRALLAHSSAERNFWDTLRELNFAIRSAAIIGSKTRPGSIWPSAPTARQSCRSTMRRRSSTWPDANTTAPWRN